MISDSVAPPSNLKKVYLCKLMILAVAENVGVQTVDLSKQEG
jgi:hypothetical protein